VVTNNGGVTDFGVGLLLRAGLVKRLIASFVGENPDIEKLYLSGRLVRIQHRQKRLRDRDVNADAGDRAYANT
jgi:acyl CoA:acetate/3-ketoacid CoA transferase alpha subunit